MTYQQTKKIRALINQSQESGGLISMYISISTPDGDPELVYKRLWAEAVKLRKGADEVKAPTIPWALLAKQMKLGVAIFISPAGHVIYALEDSVVTRVVVATSFHLKPLIASYSREYSHKLLDKVMDQSHFYQHSATDDFNELKKKISSGGYKTLIVSLDDMIYHQDHNLRVLSRTQRSDKDDDVLDDLVELAIKKRIKVGVVPRDYLPQKTCLIAC